MFSLQKIKGSCPHRSSEGAAPGCRESGFRESPQPPPYDRSIRKACRRA
ncbi:hypothetical protein HMPREF0908_2010 [Selenomonas flueggei ATCC 43531]|uniref:Uncharacterized protein n=1 Tax=Selenomonas flueggei ATCC 43531 TaxID=638302 RepID=C4V6B0_9FIRM|nr:hypothetical protein HMPREF0908_2010 [Selenomonas flueggei ATCC 43531]